MQNEATQQTKMFSYYNYGVKIWYKRVLGHQFKHGQFKHGERSGNNPTHDRNNIIKELLE